MKKLILITSLTILAALPALAKHDDSVTLQVGRQKTVGKITVKFVAVDSDSRCPINVSCVWAGNARVKISVRKGKRHANDLELNSNLAPKVITFEGYDIAFVDLTPKPGEERSTLDDRRVQLKGPSKLSDATPRLTLSISKHV